MFYERKTDGDACEDTYRFREQISAECGRVSQEPHHTADGCDQSKKLRSTGQGQLGPLGSCRIER
jgi:hypothetical protein